MTDGSVRVRVPAKINLSLAVGSLGDDGYHPLLTVFHAVDVCDDVIARPRADGRICVRTVGEFAGMVRDDPTNLAWRAAALLRERAGETRGVELAVEKAIPIAGGMAGGSADAAGALLACSTAWGLDWDTPALHELAAELGSDVPFALHGHTAIGQGRGTELTSVETRGRFQWVLAIADAGLSTPAVYRRFDELDVAGRLDVPEGLIDALLDGDPHRLALSLRNDLQPAAVDLRPSLRTTLDTGVAAGALAGLVSGSGPTCAFLVEHADQADAVAGALLRLPDVRDVRRASSPARGAHVTASR